MMRCGRGQSYRDARVTGMLETEGRSAICFHREVDSIEVNPIYRTVTLTEIRVGQRDRLHDRRIVSLLRLVRLIAAGVVCRVEVADLRDVPVYYVAAMLARS